MVGAARWSMPLVLIALGFSLCVGCSAPSGSTLHESPRNRPPSAAHAPEFEPALVFEPSGAWIIDPDGRFDVGDWVAGYPPSWWPESRERPALISGRVVEADEGWARVELAAAVEGIRARDLAVEVVDRPVSVGKRFAPLRSEGDGVIAPIGSADMVVGNEVYGLLPSPDQIPRGTRLGATLAGIVSLDPTQPDTSRVKSLMGRSPVAGDRIVLLGLVAERRLAFAIAVAADDPLMGEGVSRALSVAIGEIGADATLTIGGESGPEIRVDVASDGSLRATTPWRRLLLEPTLVDGVAFAPDQVSELAQSLQMAAFELTGDYARAAFVGERALAAPSVTDDQWIRLGPALVRCYREVRRGDWATELILQLDAASTASPDSADLLQAAYSAAAAVRGAVALERLSTRVEAVRSGGKVVAARLAWELSRSAEATGRWSDAEGWLAELAKSDEDWAEVERRRLALYRGDSASPGDTSQASDPTARLAANGYLALAHDDTSALLSLIDEIDAAEAPAVAFELLSTAVALGILAPDQALMQAASFAHAARKPNWTVAVLAALETQRLDAGTPVVLAGDLGRLYLNGLAGLDQRLLLGRRALVTGVTAADYEAQIEALTLAAGLFESIGDPLNLAIALLRTAQVEHARGRKEAALALVRDAAALEPAARDGALVALRRSIEDGIEAEGSAAEP